MDNSEIFLRRKKDLLVTVGSGSKISFYDLEYGKLEKIIYKAH